MARRALPPLPKVVLANGKRPCRGCGAEVPKGFATWCSKECRERGYMALSTWARHHVYRRDKGVCANCGLDTDKCRRIVHALKRGSMNDSGAAQHALGLLQSVWGMGRNTMFAVWRGPAWEADHIIPLVEGGSNDLSNYRTLCVQCHKAETKALAARRAAARRSSKAVTPPSSIPGHSS